MQLITKALFITNKTSQLILMKDKSYLLFLYCYTFKNITIHAITNKTAEKKTWKVNYMFQT